MSMKREALVSFRGERSQTEMAQEYGVSQQAWSAWELGVATPPPRIMKRLEQETGIPMETIFFDRFNQENQ